MTAHPERDALGRGVEEARQRLQRVVAALLVAVLPWLVAPGLVQPDTKTDLVLSPGRYLGRALWAWNDHTGIGELQNQAYGYLFPMGPVFLAGEAAGLPDWAVQRLWWMLLLVVAFVGAERVAARLAGLPTVPAMVVGAAFALSPRVLTVLSEISVEVWPQAVAPWLLLAAAKGVAPGAVPATRRRMAVTTGVLAACLGGVNATVSLVALVPAAAWVVLAPAGRGRWRALGWWLLGAVAGAAWWLGPLLVLGRYSYPFLDHIELASTTTAVASVTNVLRGTNHWIAYILTSGDHPTWQSGWLLAQSVGAIIATTALAGLGLAGLVRRRHEAAAGRPAPDPGAHLTRWAVLLVLLGVVAMAVGRTGSASGPLATTVQQWLDGPLAPLRNVHKADLLVRLPVALGVGLLAHWATRVERGAGPIVRQVVVVSTVLALLGSLAPLWVGRAGDAWATTGVPQTWHRAAAEVDDLAARDGGTTLVLPGARSADFTWGRTTDEPLTALAESPVLARAAAPLGHPGATRVLDHLDEMTAGGHRQPQLAAGLQRLGVSRVVVRGGLSADVGAVDPQRVAATLAASPGLTRVWTEGDGSEQVSIWRLDSPARPGTLVPSSGLVEVAGAPEAWFSLVATGLLDPDAVTTTAGDSAEVRTDSLRWQALNSGRPSSRGHGPTLPAEDPRPQVVGTRDLAPGGQTMGRTTRFHDGITGVTTSSSAAAPFARYWRSAGSGPAAMLDGDARTAWLSGDGEPVQRVTLRLPEGSRPTGVLVHEAWGGDIADLEAVEVGGSDGVKREGTETWRVPLDGRARDRVTLELRRSGDDPTAAQAPVGIREVEFEGGPRATTGLTLPEGDGAVLVTRDPRGAADPMAGEDPQDLVRDVGRLPETRVSATVRLRPGEEAQDVVTAPWSLTGSTQPTSSEGASDLSRWPVAAIDADPTTRWRPAPGPDPVLTFDLGERRSVETITLDRAAGPVTVATESARYVLPSGTSLRIPPQQTRHLTLTFSRPQTRASWSAPEVTLDGVEGPSSEVSLECSEAGAVGRESGRIGLALTAPRPALVAGDAVPATSCGSLPAGTGVVSASATAALLPETLTLVPTDWTATDVTPQRSVTSTREHTGRWTFEVGAGEESLLVLSQGANDGWRATDGQGRALETTTVDGWRQAVVVPAGGAQTVTVDFAPNAQHRLALLLGALAVVLLALWGAVELWVLRRARWASGAAQEEELPEGPAEGAARGHQAPLLVAVLLGGLVGLLVAGWWGLLAGALAALVPIRSRALAVAVVLTAAGLALAVLGVAERQSAGALVSQVLGTITLGVLAAALVRPSSGGPDAGPGAPGPATTDAPDPR